MPEHAQGGRDRGQIRVELEQSLAVHHRMILPAPIPQDEIAGRESGMVRFHDLSHRAAHHHVADVYRVGVGSDSRDASAHVGID